MNYFVFTPYEVYTEDQLTSEFRAQLAREGRKCLAIVFNCKDYEGFKRKYFGE